MDDVKQILVPSGHSVQTAMLISKLKDGSAGDTYTDVQLKEICGKDTRTNQPGYPNLQSAIRYVLRVHQIIWKRVAKLNLIKCAGPDEGLSHIETDLNGIRRHSKRAAMKAIAVSRFELLPETSSRLNILTAQLGALTQISSRQMTKKLESTQPISPDMTKLLEVFQKNR
jgi:hypothetical protein